jgi:hypothetical protein
MITQEKTEMFGEKPAPVPLFPLQITHEITCYQTRAPLAVGIRQLTT